MRARAAEGRDANKRRNMDQTFDTIEDAKGWGEQERARTGEMLYAAREGGGGGKGKGSGGGGGGVGAAHCFAVSAAAVG